MPIERKKGKAEPKDVKAKQDSFDEANPHLAQDAVSELIKERAEVNTMIPTIAEVTKLHAVDTDSVDPIDPFVIIFESEVSSIYALQVGNGCIVKTIHAEQVNVTFVPGAVIITGKDGKFKLKGRN